MKLFHTILTIAAILQSTHGVEPDIPICAPAGAEGGACDCENLSLSPWGTRVTNINCQSKNFTITSFEWELLPAFTNTIDLSWNNLEYVPHLESPFLKQMIASHNNVTTLDDNNFTKLPNLLTLDLSWNRIEIISGNAFIGLENLKVLDISHNNLKISYNVFSYLISLDELNMAWNENLNETFAIHDIDLFVGLGVTPKLKTLKLGHCGLSYLDLSDGTNLTNVHLEWNNLTSVPSSPRGIKFLDMSGNPIEVMGSKFLPQMYQLEILLMEDMPQLREISAFALNGLPALKKVSFQNSRRLEKLSPEAFDAQNETETSLEELILRGAPLDTLNSSLASVFKNLKTIDLAGLPLDCDCRIIWVKHLGLETGAQCKEPKILRGDRVSAMTFNESECKQWPGWISHTMHGLMLVVFLVLCSVGFYMLVVRLRPLNRSTMRKVGPTSPYAPITIEPNRAENHF